MTAQPTPVSALDDLPTRTPAPSGPSPADVYRARCARFAAERDRLEGRLRWVGYARLLTFTVATALVVWALVSGIPTILVGAAAGLVLFVGLVFYNERLSRAHQRARELWRLNDEGLRRLARDWDGLPVPGAAAPPDHPYAEDLDLFGRASLFQLLGPVGTPPGETTLRDWLCAPASPPTVRERQAAVAELAPLVDFRDELALRGRLIGAARPEPEPFLAWAEDEPWLTRRPGLVWASRLLALGTCALLLAQLVGLLDQPWWLALALVNVVLSQTAGRDVDRLLAQVTSNTGALQHYAASFELLGQGTWQAPLLRLLQAALAQGAGAAAPRTRELERLVRLDYLRLSMFYFPVQTLTLWNFHVLALLEGWQRVAGKDARGWLRALGEAEALASLGTLAYDHPDWAFPAVEAMDAPLFDARALGHPLLPDDARVTNDVRVGPPGTVLLVTGSNMSGKSTLLRAIGANTVLAQAGGPVCAAALRLPPLVIRSSIRVQDSLERGVSYFMAELQRLKEVVDAAEQVRASGKGTLLFLLDEILHGTNTAERQIAARRVILHLVAQGAIGAVSTHDLTLAAGGEIAAAGQPVHFTESFEAGPDGPLMTFDYRLRPGLAPSTNALKLMELVGLALDGRTAPEPGGAERRNG
jgi:energy-coupling factor transporter ATP-binding protein EcfA2